MDELEPTIILSGASNTSHLTQNLNALNFVLNKDELSKLRSFVVSPEKYWQERNKLDWN